MIKLYKHQEEMILKAKPILDEYNLVYIAAETRTGKSLATIYLLKDDYEKILVLTKKKAISSWENDLNLSNAKNFTVTNYEAIHKLVDDDYDVIVLDEAHSIGSYPKPSKRAEQIKAIAADRKIVYLSATPSAETYSQLFHQFWISSYPPFEEKNFYKWFKEYGIPESFYINGMKINSYKKTEEELIQKEIKHLFVVMTKKKANFKILVEEKIHEVEINQGYTNALNSFYNHRVLKIGDYDVVAESAVSTLGKLHQLTGGTIKIDDDVSLITSTHKVNYIKENLSQDEKIVILCNYVEERNLLLKELGSSTDEVQEFKNKDYKYFIGHIKTFSEGVDFSYADSMIIYSLNFSATTYLQSKERLANKKRTKPILVNYLFTKNSIDEKIYEAVKNKMNFTNSYYKNCI